MRIDKQGSKGGNYVGGLLHLFDWNAKSQKKLLSSESDLLEKPKQTRILDENLPTTRLQMLDEDEIITAGSSMNETSDHGRASSVTNDDFYINKAPNVVARLMGLDSMPISNICEPNSTPLSDYYKTENLDFRRDPQIRHSTSGLHVVPLIESKYVERPIKKFQTEILPPKSAKSIPNTHHKLLSLIKSANSIPSKNADCVMEGGVAIIAPSRPKASNKTNLPLDGSSLKPLKVRDSKEKVQVVKKRPKLSDGFQRPSESSVHVNNNGKSISLALQAKANVQKRERALIGQLKTTELSPYRVFTSEPVAQNSTLKKPCKQKSSNALRQNNQKQNCTVDRKNHLKALNGSFSNVVGPSKVKDGNKRRVLSRSLERATRKKRSIDDASYHSKQNPELRNVGKCKNGKVVRSSGVMDVVSFTFNAPMTRNGSPGGSGGPANSHSKRIMLDSDGIGARKLPSLGHNAEGYGIISSFLERKLTELTHKTKSGRVFSIRSNMIEENISKDGNYADNLEGQQGPKGLVDEIGMRGRNLSDETTLPDCHLPSPVSVLDHFFITGSCNSSDSADSNIIGGDKHFPSIQCHDVISRYSINGNADYLSDLASSTLQSPHCKKPTCWELDYVTKLLCNIELMSKDYALGNASDIIKPHIFHQLEKSQKGNVSRINRRLMFDCVNECMDVRCRQFVQGGYNLWAKGVFVVNKRKEKLAEDVYKEISSWSSMGDYMVDEIVDNDMSSKQGSWLDYDIEAFELGVVIEFCVLSILIDEIVDDILVL